MTKVFVVFRDYGDSYNERSDIIKIFASEDEARKFVESFKDSDRIWYDDFEVE